MPSGSSTPSPLSVAIATIGNLLLLQAPQGLAAPLAGSVLLELPPDVTIQLKSSKTISGVRLKAVSSSGIKYDKGGIRFLPASEVKRVIFRGRLVIEGPRRPVVASSDALRPLSLPDSEKSIPAMFKNSEPEVLGMFPNIFGKKPDQPRPLSCQEKVSAILVDPSVDTSGVRIQTDGRRLRILTRTPPETSKASVLIVHELLYDSNKNLRFAYKTCSLRAYL